MPAVTINYLAVLVAAVASMVVGFIWYGPLFGKVWMGLTGKRPEDAKGPDAMRGYAVSFIAALITAYILSHLVDYAGAKTYQEGAVAGFWVWLGFVATTMGVNYVFSGKPLKLYLIDAGNQLVSIAVMGAIVAAWV